MNKVIIMTDLEGAAGVVSFDLQTRPDTKYYEQAKKLLTAEVNVAVQTLAQNNIDDILVIDGHGPGAIAFEDLHHDAKLLHGRPFPLKIIQDEIIPQYHAAIIIGQHAMAGTPRGTLNHTQSSTSVESYTLNGKPIGEIAQVALLCGANNVPLIFLSGDQAACDEAKNFIPQITTAAVKIGLNRTAAISLAAPKAHQIIQTQLQTAIDNHKQKPIPPLTWPGPYTLDIRYLFTETADIYLNNPKYQRIDPKTVRIQAENIKDIIGA